MENIHRFHLKRVVYIQEYSP